MAAIAILEGRLSELEQKIYGSSAPLIDDSSPESAVIDSLLHVNTLISSGLSGREKANALVKNLPQLNELLDTSYDDGDLQAEAKLEVILAMESEIKKNLELLCKVQELKPALEIDKIKNIPELTPKLKHLTFNYLKLYEESSEVSHDIHQVFSKYNNIIDIISKSLISLDVAITAAEIAAAPKKQLD